MKPDAAVASAGGQDSVQIRRSPRRRGYHLEASQFLPHPRERIFEFFSDAFQLQTLTPPWLHFSVLTSAPIRMESGLLIDYRLRVHGIPLRWQSCISECDPPLLFTDCQRRGPNREWNHQNIFEVVDGGTLCRDVVEYAVYGGSLINTLFIQPDLLKIFRYRQTRLRELFSAEGIGLRGA